MLLSPAAVKTELQRQHISKELIEYGFEKAKELVSGALNQMKGEVEYSFYEALR